MLARPSGVISWLLLQEVEGIFFLLGGLHQVAEVQLQMPLRQAATDWISFGSKVATGAIDIQDWGTVRCT